MPTRILLLASLAILLGGCEVTANLRYTYIDSPGHEAAIEIGLTRGSNVVK